MLIVDTALKKRAEENNPIRVGILGAGFMCQGLANQIANSVPGMRLAAISNRRPERALNVLTYCGLYTIEDAPKRAVRGVADNVVERLRALGAVEGPRRFRGVFLLFDPEAVKLVLDELCAEAGVNVLLHAPVIAATREARRVTSVTVHDSNGPHVIAAPAFVDASGDCDLAFLAGASTRYGNHGAINMGTLGVRFGGIARDAEVSAARWSEAVRAAKRRGAALSKETGLVVRLPISIASHSPLMARASEGMNRLLQKLPMHDPAQPIVGNVNADVLDSQPEVYAELRDQLLMGVRWQKSIEQMTADGVDMFIEAGPGNVLTRLVRRINYDVNSLSLSDEYEGLLGERFHLVEAAAQ